MGNQRGIRKTGKFNYDDDMNHKFSDRLTFKIGTETDLHTLFYKKIFFLNPSGTKGGSKTTPPLGFSSVVFARGMILKRNFG